MNEAREKYIRDIELALSTNQHARAFYFPPNRAKRFKMNERLGREIGVGLVLFPAQSYGDLYSRLIVRYSLDSTGVSIDAKDFHNSIKEGIEHPTQRRSNLT